MLRTLTLFALLITLFSCGAPATEPETTVAAETNPSAEVATSPETPTTTKDKMDDATELVSEDKVAKENIKPKTTVTAPEKPKSPTPKTTKPKVTTGSTSPAPKAPNPAPAPPPVKEALPTTPPAAPAPPATPTEEAPVAAPAVPAKPDHAVFNTLLGKYVNSSGNVNYGALKKDEAKLDAYIEELSTNSPKSDWSRKESMAFWINAYNANTLKLILKNYPVKSITDLDGGKPWDVKWIKIGGKTYSLNNIEHDIIRPRYKDARIHFAVNCAAASCPPLPNKAFTAANLNSLLASRTRSFIRNGNYNTITEGNVKVSKIFDWYGEDFGDLRQYLNKYATIEIPEGAEIGFEEYDWALNKQ